MGVDMRVIVDAGAKPAATFHQRNFQTCFGQDVCGDPSTGTASDNANVEGLLRHLPSFDLQERLRPLSYSGTEVTTRKRK
jgi:hypothetical protein